MYHEEVETRFKQSLRDLSQSALIGPEDGQEKEGEPPTSSKSKIPHTRRTSIKEGIVKITLRKEIIRRLWIIQGQIAVEDSSPATVDRGRRLHRIRREHGIPLVRDKLTVTRVR